MTKKWKKHRIGSGFEPTAPTGLIEHSRHGNMMERSFESPFINKMVELLARASTSDDVLSIASKLPGSHVAKIIKWVLDPILIGIDNRIFNDTRGAKEAFLGTKRSSMFKSTLFGYLWTMISKYIGDWKKNQYYKKQVYPPRRKLYPLKKTFRGWKSLRDAVQPGWEVFPANPKRDVIKVFQEDTMMPRERIERIIAGKDTDRVSFGPQFDWAVPFMGGSNLWKFSYDGIETGWASLNTWIRIGGCDFIPQATGAAAYTVPFPDAHSRFFYNWTYPDDNLVPQFIEKEILKSYDDLRDNGIVGLAGDITRRMVRDTFLLARELIYNAKIINHYFGPYREQFFPYAQLMLSAWDLLPMWRGMVPFMRDMKKNPEAVIEAFDFINKPFTDLMINLGKFMKVKIALIGNSRGSSSWISPKMFEHIFWPSMKYSFDQCLKHDIIPMCHFDNDWTENMPFFAEHLPKRSCVFHLDQVDLVEIHDLIGDHFSLMGGMSPALLVHGSPSKVEAETRRYIKGAGSAGLIIASGCEYPADIPIANVFAQKRAIREHGFFKN
ncbi:MAG: uroporphyrinogen decarboxylase family protein [Promethearchaeota archaeon]